LLSDLQLNQTGRRRSEIHLTQKTTQKKNSNVTKKINLYPEVREDLQGKRLPEVPLLAGY
jgi:hypothetical protein